MSDINHAVRPSGSATGTYPSAVAQPPPDAARAANAASYSSVEWNVPAHGSGVSRHGRVAGAQEERAREEGEQETAADGVTTTGVAGRGAVARV